MTDRQHHWIFFQQLHISHLLTFCSSSARWSGSDFMIWSNSANWRTDRQRSTEIRAVILTVEGHISVLESCSLWWAANWRGEFILWTLPFQGGRTLWSVQTWSHCHSVPELWTTPVVGQIQGQKTVYNNNTWHFFIVLFMELKASMWGNRFTNGSVVL